MKITSVFGDYAEIPVEYTCLGENKNPPFLFIEVPNEAVSLALLIEDMDAESKVWTHWSLYNIPAGCLSMEAGSIPEGAVQGLCNNFTLGYQGPCPKYFTGTHRYRITLLALSEWLPSANPLTPEEVWKQAAGSLLEKAELVGLCTSKEEGP